MWFRRRRPLSTEEKVARIIARNQAHAAWLCFMRRVATYVLVAASCRAHRRLCEEVFDA